MIINRRDGDDEVSGCIEEGFFFCRFIYPPSMNEVRRSENPRKFLSLLKDMARAIKVP